MLLSQINDCVDRGKLEKRRELLDELSLLSEKIEAIENIDTYDENIASATSKPDIQSIEESVLKEPELPAEEEKKPEPETAKQNEKNICQYCLKEVSQVHKCTKCGLDLCSKHASNHSCIKGSILEPESRILPPSPEVERRDTLESLKSQYRRLISQIDDCVDNGHLIKRKKLLGELFILSDKIRAIETPMSEPTGEKPSHKPDWVEIENKKHKSILPYIPLAEETIKVPPSEPESPPHPIAGIELQDKPIKSLNWNAIIIILVGIILSSFIISNFLDTSNSQGSITPSDSQGFVAPSNSSNDNVEEVTKLQLAPKDSFKKINEYREQNKQYKILWSDYAYRLADFRASDMVKRNYFSRTTPDGKNVSDYIGKYNFNSDSAWGENLCKGCSDPAQTWIESVEHREVLLGGWKRGAVACESDICVFIGVDE